ncbi:DUF3813 domain-containing protein [Rossellomorea vietnamensis]|uniref:DUF3813 domain-containing protein n=2 Tax=Rossellomorea TaxID=2837508 RepID=A0A5D4KM39_9BACI|nr:MULTISPECIES: DUF3813 domain-containing protein [Rossellomorea]TYR77815.1 DUF3813 domain-containing protein [Rossellomorea vietnamensis]TYS83355.1 DUF3813 domain-containing protein [Rossellomorea aquimaris]
MGNRLFQEARQYVQLAKEASTTGSEDTQQTIARAKNALSSAYANTTRAEQEQLRELQSELNQLH